MLTFVLVRAGEGTTQDIYVAHGMTLEALAHIIDETWTAHIAACPGPWRPGHQGHMAREKLALLAMLADHSPCAPGRYVLPYIDPVWEQVTLLITEQDVGSLEAEA